MLDEVPYAYPRGRGGAGHDGQESILTDFAEFVDAMPEEGKWD